LNAPLISFFRSRLACVYKYMYGVSISLPHTRARACGDAFGRVDVQTFRASLICCFLARFSSLVSSFLRAWPRLTAGCSSLCVR
jgi:hypothetical protein